MPTSASSKATNARSGGSERSLPFLRTLSTNKRPSAAFPYFWLHAARRNGLPSGPCDPAPSHGAAAQFAPTWARAVIASEIDTAPFGAPLRHGLLASVVAARSYS